MLPLHLLREVILFLSLPSVHTFALVSKSCAQILSNDKLWSRKYARDFDQHIFGQWVREQQLSISHRSLYFLHYYLNYTKTLEETKENAVKYLIETYFDRNERADEAIEGESIIIHYSMISAPMEVYRTADIEERILLPTQAMINLTYRVEGSTLIYYALITEMMDELDEVFNDFFPNGIPILYQMTDVSLDLVLYYISYFRENGLVPQPYHLTIPTQLIVSQLIAERKVSVFDGLDDLVFSDDEL